MQGEITLKISQIVQGNNPRTYFDEKEMAALRSSIKAQGVLQAILVRPLPNGMYEIVAGERRWRAAKDVFGEDFDMPVIIREMSDVQVTAASSTENTERAAMSPAEESQAAAKLLGECNGDYEEAAKRLGCTRSTFEKRLSLMQCSEKVRDALNKRLISLGLAELFATAPKEKQDIVLEKLLKLPALPTVAEFKSQLQQHSKSLAAAIFDKTECAGCQYNSTNQSQLFAEAISDGHCTNSPCYDAKTAAELNNRVEALKDDFPTVKVIKSGENFTVIKIVAEGATGVGEEQAKACRGCSNFGAAVSDLPGSVGKVYRDQCFDTGCNSNKVAARIKAEKALTEPEKPKASEPSTDKDKEKSASKPVKTETKATVTDSPKVKEYRVKVWRKIMVKELMADVEKNKIVLLAVGICDLGRNISGSKLTQGLNKLTGSSFVSSTGQFADVINTLQSANDEAKTKLHMGLTASIEDAVDERVLRQILTYLEVDMAKHWKLSKDYLDTMTKSEIDVVMDEIGLKAFIGKDYSKLMTGKKDDLIKSLLAVDGFDYQGKLPKVMFYQQ